MSAIALPSFLNQANKAKQSEAKTYVGSMNRAQQAYYLENTQFALSSNFGNLGLGVATQTTNYKYMISSASTATAVTNQAKTVIDLAPLKSYVGGVMVGVSSSSEATTLAALCEATQSKVNAGADVTDASFPAGGPSCPANYVSLAK